MKRKLGILLCCAMLVFALAGCQLAKADAGSAAAKPDRLIGVLVTPDHLDLPGGRQDAVQTGASFKFENINGSSLYAAMVDEALIQGGDGAMIIDASMSVHTGDGMTGINIDLEGSIYALSTDNMVFWFNPIYQSADGGVYVTGGQGMAAPGGEGISMYWTMNGSNTVAENGSTTSTDGVSIKITVYTLAAPEKVVVLQMDADSNPLFRTEYAPDAMPDMITPEQGAAYLIVETHRLDAGGNRSVDREIVDRSAESLDTLVPGADGIFVKHSAQIDWPGQG